METIIIICVLALIFVSAFFSLVLVCRHKNIRSKTSHYVKKISNPQKFHHDNSTLLVSDLELGEVCLHPQIEQILEQWTADASGLITHCLEILKLCRRVTNRVAALMVGHQNAKTLNEIIQVAKRISVRVDDMVRTMYPPLDSCLLEARSVALVLAVTQLTLVAKNGIREASSHLEWADQALADMDVHLMVLREAALSQEAASCIQTATGSKPMNKDYK
ncbi:transmembrane protein 98-like [Lycorma delicatula]|uniref:transmembrane protein 98-like n=1 Tax=Lycorma delicatula TaxID=130591 RepID=UPI003F515CA0